jgi:hypothetical protein
MLFEADVPHAGEIFYDNWPTANVLATGKRGTFAELSKSGSLIKWMRHEEFFLRQTYLMLAQFLGGN